MVTEKRLNEMLAEEIDRAEIGGLEIGEIVPRIAISRKRSAYGTIVKGASGRYVIYISKFFLTAPEEEIRTVICHEVCHAVKGCMAHNEAWARATRVMRKLYHYMNADYHLNPHPYSRGRATCEHTTIERAVKYIIVCSNPKCTCKVTRARMCDLVKNINNYRCGRCKSSLKLVG